MDVLDLVHLSNVQICRHDRDFRQEYCDMTGFIWPNT